MKSIRKIIMLVLFVIFLGLIKVNSANAKTIKLSEIFSVEKKDNTSFTILLDEPFGNFLFYEVCIRRVALNNRCMDDFINMNDYNGLLLQKEIVFQISQGDKKWYDKEKKKHVINFPVYHNNFNLPGIYYVKVRSAINMHFVGENIYSGWSKEKKIVLKEPKSSRKGYKKTYDFSKKNIGDTVKFGSYEQDGDYTNGKEPIEWIIIDKNDKTILLLSKYILDILPYNKEIKPSNWGECSLRKWLNNDFIIDSFNTKESSMIKTSKLENNDSKETYYTKDKVFLISLKDSVSSKFSFDKRYSSDDINRRCALTWQKDTKAQATDTDPITLSGNYTYPWWLRDSFYDAHVAYYVNFDGEVLTKKYKGDYTKFRNVYYAGVRPALYISLKSS